MSKCIRGRDNACSRQPLTVSCTLCCLPESFLNCGSSSSIMICFHPSARLNRWKRCAKKSCLYTDAQQSVSILGNASKLSASERKTTAEEYIRLPGTEGRILRESGRATAGADGSCWEHISTFPCLIWATVEQISRRKRCWTHQKRGGGLHSRDSESSSYIDIGLPLKDLPFV